MDITQTFYNRLAAHYDKLFLDWKATTRAAAADLICPALSWTAPAASEPKPSAWLLWDTL